jgi:quercetin dioxygenase-like cupin family protein
MNDFHFTVIDPKQIKAAELVLPCSDLNEALGFYTKDLGFRVDAIYPADAPRIAVISGYGVRIRLEHDTEAAPNRIRLLLNDIEPGSSKSDPLYAPDGTRIEFAPVDTPLDLPPLAATFVLQQASEDSWGTGRAGMKYRDLIPDRLGGRYIASHIRIPNGGPVPDYVHHHHVRFQMIYCYNGWVKVVYEDQGPPFVMNAGDCVLQPPHIRHRVLECSDDMQVIEISCPAEHETLIDHDMELPTTSVHLDREFSGQRFVYHQVNKAKWRPGPFSGFEARDTGIGKATEGLASAQIIRPSGNPQATVIRHNGEFFFNFVLQGTTTLQRQRQSQQALSAGDSFVIPAGMQITLTECSKDLELLQVASNQG